ncbi:MAG TPA: hypothetical protein VK469_20395 [Candidatus Kapabacteria bacterium]|nr:hypothetical protein [Candidatus Kapabacteria bacterium]
MKNLWGTLTIKRDPLFPSKLEPGTSQQLREALPTSSPKLSPEQIETLANEWGVFK